MSIIFHSIDWDSCLGGFNYSVVEKAKKYAPEDKKNLFYKYKASRDKNGQHLFENNEPLINKILELSKQHQKAIILVGSNRQSLEIDRFNRWKFPYANTGNCFKGTDNLTRYLNSQIPDMFTFNHFLLEDVYQSLTIGTTMLDDALSKSNKKIDGKRREPIRKYNERCFDPTKTTLIYAQMQEMAKQIKEGDTGEFHFYDDIDVILFMVHGAFSRHPELIPSNITLHLHLWGNPTDVNETHITKFKDYANPIQGKGMPLENYDILLRDKATCDLLGKPVNIVDEIALLHKNMIANPSSKVSPV